MKLTAKKEEALKKRAALKELSKSLKNMADIGLIAPSEDGTINGLLRAYYAQGGAKDLKTFSEWKKLGYSIKKGAKALLLWGKPKKKESEQAKEEPNEKETATEKEPYYPVAYMFSSDQVQLTNNK